MSEAMRPTRVSMPWWISWKRAERAAVAGEFFGELRALVLHEIVERAHLQRQRVVRGLGLAHHLGDQRVDGDVERVARLVA